MATMHVSKYTAKQIDEAIDRMLKKPQSNTCPNCGAPLNQYGGCDYCGTGKQAEKPMPQMKYQYMGEDINEGEAVVVLGGKPHRCYVSSAEMFVVDNGTVGRNIRGDFVRYGSTIPKFYFTCIEM